MDLGDVVYYLISDGCKLIPISFWDRVEVVIYVFSGYLCSTL